MSLPIAFVTKIKTQHPENAHGVINALAESEALVSVRYHSFKSEPTDATNIVAWCPHAVYLERRPIFTLDPTYHGGAYYVQEASSMVLFHILQSLPKIENPFVLDLCAAPGGKSTLILDWLQNKGLLVANEVIKARANILQENIMKWGYTNAVVTSNDPKDFEKLNSFFDIVVIDAPCSGEGMFRKDETAINEWSEDHVNHCAVRQQRIVYDAYEALKDDGFLIYSTCTFNNEENIDNVKTFVKNLGMHSIKIEMDAAWNITHIQNDMAQGYQFFPGKTKGEGLFIAVLQKKNSNTVFAKPKIKIPKLLKPNKATQDIISKWIDTESYHELMHENGNVYVYNESLYGNIEYFLQALNVKYSGTLAGNVQKQNFIPDHALALSICKNKGIPKIDFNKETALKFLNRTLQGVEDSRTSWLLAVYNNVPIGWLKNLGNRINNYYPMEWRIRMDINNPTSKF